MSLDQDTPRQVHMLLLETLGFAYVLARLSLDVPHMVVESICILLLLFSACIRLLNHGACSMGVLSASQCHGK
jgi:hypothetical protein